MNCGLFNWLLIPGILALGASNSNVILLPIINVPQLKSPHPLGHTWLIPAHGAPGILADVSLGHYNPPAAAFTATTANAMVTAARVTMQKMRHRCLRRLKPEPPLPAYAARRPPPFGPAVGGLDPVEVPPPRAVPLVTVTGISRGPFKHTFIVNPWGVEINRK